MTPPGRPIRSLASGRTIGYAAGLVAANFALGCFLALSLAFVWSDVMSLILVPLGAAERDPTANDDPTGFGFGLVVILVAVFWAINYAFSRGRLQKVVIWPLATLSLLAPTALIVAYLTFRNAP